MKNTKKRVLRNTALLVVGVVTLFAMKGCKNDSDSMPEPKLDPVCECDPKVHPYGEPCQCDLANCECTNEAEVAIARTETITFSFGSATLTGTMLGSEWTTVKSNIITAANAAYATEDTARANLDAVFMGNGLAATINLKNNLTYNWEYDPSEGNAAVLNLKQNYVLTASPSDLQTMFVDAAAQMNKFEPGQAKAVPAKANGVFIANVNHRVGMQLL